MKIFKNGFLVDIESGECDDEEIQLDFRVPKSDLFDMDNRLKMYKKSKDDMIKYTDFNWRRILMRENHTKNKSYEYKRDLIANEIISELNINDKQKRRIYDDLRIFKPHNRYLIAVQIYKSICAFCMPVSYKDYIDIFDNHIKTRNKLSKHIKKFNRDLSFYVSEYIDSLEWVNHKERIKVIVSRNFNILKNKWYGNPKVLIKCLATTTLKKLYGHKATYKKCGVNEHTYWKYLAKLKKRGIKI